ncbi:MAG TPA: SPOR domain-containing protein, partial [Candidatus Competibacteraceae bacterium]|nr:SPOR domain-containing protein [Candidatus Competibacteraceae bacterium]
GVVFGGETARSRDSHMSEILDTGFAQMGTGGAVWQTASRAYPSSSGTSLYPQPGSYSISRVATPTPVSYSGDRFDSAYPATRSSETAARLASTDLAAVVDTRPKVTYSGPPVVTVAQAAATDSETPTSASIQPFQRYSSGAVIKGTPRVSEPYPTASAPTAGQDSANSRRAPASWSAGTAAGTYSTPAYSGTSSTAGARNTPFYTYTGASPASSTRSPSTYTYTGASPAAGARSAPSYTGDNDRFKDNPAYDAAAAEQESSNERTEATPVPVTTPTTRVTAVPTWRSGNSISAEEPGRYSTAARAGAGAPLPPPTLIAQSKPTPTLLQGDDDEASDTSSKASPTRVTSTPATSTPLQGNEAKLPDAPPRPIPTLSPRAGFTTPAGKGETNGPVELIGRPMYQEVTTESSTSQPELFPKSVPAQQKPAVAEKAPKETVQEEPVSVSSDEDEEQPLARSSRSAAADKKPAPTAKKAPSGKAEPAKVVAKAASSDKKASADKIAKADKADKKLASQDNAPESRKADKFAQSKAATLDKAKAQTIKVAAVAPAAPAAKPGLCQVQVGAFSSKADAAKQLVQASRVVPALLSPGRAVVTTVDRDGKTLYRACFKGLSQAEVGNACQTLKRKQMGCFLQQGS